MIRWAAMLLLTAASPATAAWRMAETANFRVFSEGSESLLRERAALLEDYRGLLSTMTTAKPLETPTPKLDVFLVHRIAEARPFGRPPKDSAGFYTVSSGRIAAFVETQAAAQTILLHEYAHHFMLGNARAAYPAWYVEGFAEYFMTAEFRPDRIDFGVMDLNRARWLGYGQWLKLERIIAREPALRSREDTAMYYAQSWLLTHYLFRAEGMGPKFRSYLQSVARGEDSVTAFKTLVDADLVGLERRLRVYAARKFTFSRYSRPAATPAAVTITTLPAATEPMLLQLVSLELGLPEAEGALALATVKATAARFPGDPLAARTLAFAELRHGDRAAAIARIDALLATAPADPTLLRWRALAALPKGQATAAAASEARRLLVRSFRADPNDWRTLLLYAQLAEPFRKPLNPQTFDVLLRAYELAPQVETVVITTAAALARADRLPEAATVLTPLAFAPHGGSAATVAGRLLDLARAGNKAELLAVLDGVGDIEGENE